MTKTINERARGLRREVSQIILGVKGKPEMILPATNQVEKAITTAMREVAEECAGIARDAGEVASIWTGPKTARIIYRVIRARFNIGGDDDQTR